MKILFVVLILLLFNAVFAIGQTTGTLAWTKSTSNIVGRIDTSDLIRNLKRSIMYHLKKGGNGTQCGQEKDIWSSTAKFSKVTADFDMKPVMRELKRRLSYQIQTGLIDSQNRKNYSQSVVSILSSEIDTKIAAQDGKITSISSEIDSKMSAQGDVITSIDATSQKMKDDMAALITENNELKQNQEESKKNQEDLNARLQVLEKMCTSKPAFFATLGNHISFGKSEILKFDVVKTNTGGGYEAISGIFIVPKSGTYQFTSIVYSYRNDDSLIQMNKNNDMIVKGYSTGYVDGTSHAMNVVLVLQKGDQIYVQHRGGSTDAIHGELHSTFSGFMISD